MGRTPDRTLRIRAKAAPRPTAGTGMAGGDAVDVRELETALASAVEGEVRFDTASRGLYATDASNYRQVPIGVVVPRTLDDVVAVHAVCHDHGAPVLSRGGGTSLSGETVNWAVVIDHSKYLNRVLDVDADRRLATVESGCINEHVNRRTSPEGLVFGPDPSTHRYCTIGGNVGNNSCGIHSVQSEFYGDGARTSDNVHSLEVVTYDGTRMTIGPAGSDDVDAIVAAGGRKGEIYAGLRDLRDRYAGAIRDRYPPIQRRVSGYNLDDLLSERGFDVAAALCGTEGTCATVLTATLKLVPALAERTLVVLGYEDIAQAARDVMTVREFRPIGIEAIDHRLFVNVERLGLHPGELSLMPGGDAWLLVQFGADSKADADALARDMLERVRRSGRPPVDHRIFRDPAQERRLWRIRESGLAATAFPPSGGDHWPGWEDSAVPPERMGEYVEDLQRLYAEHGYTGAMYGHFGQGCLHSRIDFDFRTSEGIATYRRFMEAAADLCVSYGGSLSGEHGDGQQRAELLPKMFGDELIQAFREFKAIWDPDWKMNPGKVVDAYRIDENLKLGSDHRPWRPSTHFSYADDGYDFAHATLRCVGVGRCRIPSGDDVMCPSYMVTREEKHTTRGRARLLFEMLQGDVVTDGWRSEEVRDALDLCLACKGCTNDCPVNVDMPTYKAEFLHHHWKGRIRPRSAYAFGSIDRAAWIASAWPAAANRLLAATPTAAAVKWAGGVSRRRPAPTFAPLQLRRWFHRRDAPTMSGPRVVLWPDTFTNYMHTDVGVAAVEVLEDAGFRVTMPRRHLCCGRPLYDYGFLHAATRYLRRVLDDLRDEIRAGTPVVGVEPSCVATFKDELPKLFPHDEDAARLASQTYHFAEFLERHGVVPPAIDARALLWGHCHQKATGGIDPDEAVLSRMGADVERVTGGCCGLAGSWGFEEGHHDISIECGEQALLPAVRRAEPETIVVANGFSCRTQIEHARTGRRAMHLAQVMKLARELRAEPSAGAHPERRLADGRPRPSTSQRLARYAVTVAAGGAAAAAATACRRARRSGG